MTKLIAVGHFPLSLLSGRIPFECTETGLFWRSENTIMARAGSWPRGSAGQEIIEVLVPRRGIAGRRLLLVCPICRDHC